MRAGEFHAVTTDKVILGLAHRGCRVLGFARELLRDHPQLDKSVHRGLLVLPVDDRGDRGSIRSMGAAYGARGDAAQAIFYAGLPKILPPAPPGDAGLSA